MPHPCDPLGKSSVRQFEIECDSVCGSVFLREKWNSECEWSQFQPQTSCPLLKSNLNPLWWKLCRLNWSTSLWENRTPQKHSDSGTKKIYYPRYFSVEAFPVHVASVNLIKPSNIVLWWQEQFQNHRLHESWIGPLPSQRGWCHQPEALSLACLEQPYFCKKHPFKKFLQRRPNDKNVLHSILCFLGVNAWCCPVKYHCLLRAEPSVSEPKTGPWGNCQCSPHITFQW